MSDVFPDTITVERDGETFVFKNPSPREYAAVLALANRMKIMDGLPNGDGADTFTDSLYFGLALFEKLLKKADTSANWPFTAQDNGEIIVDSSRFPPNKTLAIAGVGSRFTGMFFEQTESQTAA